MLLPGPDDDGAGVEWHVLLAQCLQHRGTRRRTEYVHAAQGRKVHHGAVLRHHTVEGREIHAGESQIVEHTARDQQDDGTLFASGLQGGGQLDGQALTVGGRARSIVVARDDPAIHTIFTVQGPCRALL